MSTAERQKNGTRYAAAHLLTVMLATLVLGGCGSLLPTTRIDAEDNRVFLPALRANINFGDGTQAVSEPHSGSAIEFGIAKAKGGGSQSLTAGQSPIILNGTPFSAPDQLQNDFNYNFANISWRWRKFFAERALGLEVTVGAGFSSLDLAVSSSTQRASDHFFSRGPQAGIGLIWRLNPSTSIQGRVSEFVSAANRGVNEMTRYELFYAKAFHENLTLRAGYSVWDANGQDQYGMSDFHLRASGPALALDWDIDAGSKMERPGSAAQ
jgi:hypothetical protein